MSSRPISVFSTLLLLCAVPGMSLRAEGQSPQPESVGSVLLRAATPPKIDGVLDDECWQKAETHKVHFIMGQKGVKAESVPMTAKYTWDDHFFYIGYEVFDQNLVAVGQKDRQGPPDNPRESAAIWSEDPNLKIDVVEFFITFGDQYCFWELHHNALNHFSDVLIFRDLPSWKNEGDRSNLTRYGIYFGAQEFIPDEGPIPLPDKTLHFKLAAATKLKPKADGTDSTPNKEDDKDSGYTGELRLPWYGLGAPLPTQTMIELPPEGEGKRPVFKPGGPWKMAGKDLWVIAVCQNADLKDRYHHSAENFKGGWFHHGVADYPKFKLTPPAMKD